MLYLKLKFYPIWFNMVVEKHFEHFHCKREFGGLTFSPVEGLPPTSHVVLAVLSTLSTILKIIGNLIC